MDSSISRPGEWLFASLTFSSEVLLFLADDMACNGRKGAPGAVYHHRNKILDLYGRDVEVDFRGEEVTVQNLIRLLTGRQDKGKT